MMLLSWILAIYFTNTPVENMSNLTGTWMGEADKANHLLVLEDGYLSLSKYDDNAKKFFYTKGGWYTVNKNTLFLQCEFNSANKDEVGKTLEYKIESKDNEIVIRQGEKSYSFTLLDSSSTPLTGAWRINGRYNTGQRQDLKLAPRRTIKILTGNRFQWIAINIETGDFSGTGGGTYTFKEGKYTEHIDFFSRDGSRVGASLTFNGEIKDGLWHHSGLSSKGDPIHETWEKYEQ